MSYISNLAIPCSILIILYFGLKEKLNVFDIFLEGAKEGMEIILKIFPTLIGLFLAITLLRESGFLDCFIKILLPITDFLKIPKEIMPLFLLRPISRKWVTGNRNRYNEKIWGR